VSPVVSMQASSLYEVIEAFLAELGPEFPPPLPAPTFRAVEMAQVEAELWGMLVGGLACERGVFDGEPELAADWVASLLVHLAEAGGSRHYRAQRLFDVRGCDAIAWIIVAPTRVTMVHLIGWD
jgi:hypothetical protein